MRVLDKGVVHIVLIEGVFMDAVPLCTIGEGVTDSRLGVAMDTLMIGDVIAMRELIGCWGDGV